MREFYPLERGKGIAGQLRRLYRSPNRASWRGLRRPDFPGLAVLPVLGPLGSTPRGRSLAIVSCRVHWRVHRTES
jgi:hypothetical protein